MTGRRLFKRILRGYLALAIVFTLLFGACIYLGTYTLERSRFEADTQAHITQIVHDNDLKFNLFKEAVNQIVKEDAVRSFAASQSLDTRDIQHIISKNTQTLKQQKIDVYISKLETAFDEIIGEGQVADARSFFKSLNLGTGASDTIRQYLLKSENYDKVFVRYCQKSSFGSAGLLLIVERRVINNSDVYILSTFNVDEMSVHAATYGGSISVLYGNETICNLGEKSFETINVMNNEIKKPNGEVQGEAKIVDGKIYTTAKSGIYNLVYVMALPATPLAEAATRALFISLAVCCALVLVSWAIFVLLTKWVYLPVKETMNFLSRYDSGNYLDEGVFVRQSFVNIANDNAKLREKLVETVYPLREKLLRDMLLGLADREKIFEKAEELGLEKVSGPYRAVLLKLADYETLCEAFSSDEIKKIKDQIKEFINDQLKNQIIHGAIDINPSSIAIISYGSEQHALRELLADMAMMVEGGFDVEVCGAIGAECDELAEISRSYASSCNIMENRFSVGCRNAIVTEEEVNAASSDGVYYPLDVERELIAEVIRARNEEAHKILEKILEENLEKRSLAKDRINAFIFSLTATISRIVESLNTTTEQVFSEGNIVFLDLKMCTDSDALKEKIYEIFDKLIEYVNVENKIEKDNFAVLMLDYIHEHYNEDISLLDIGGHFGLSQCYISTLFKENTGENFKEYLSRYRIKKAKEILQRDPDIKNSELAKLIGCNTVATLFRIFNKYEGISPGQYVRELKKSERKS